jgi:hypothetical protein
VRRVLFVVSVLSLGIGCSSGGPLSATTGAEGASSGVPHAVLAQVESQWRGAKVLTTGPEGAACTGLTADQAAASMKGDFNGDGSMDVALRVRRADGVHVVAAFFETYRYRLTDVARDAGGVQFSIRRRGSTYRTPDSIVDHYFSADTLVLTPCGQPPTAYIWSGGSFLPQRIEP